MGSRRIGLGRIEVLVEQLKRAIDFGTSALTAASLAITTSGLLVSAGRIRESMEVSNVDARHVTLTVERIHKGIILHTSVTGAGTATSDTAANIIAGHGGLAPLTANGQTIECLYVNDGNQDVTFAVDTGVTLANGSSPTIPQKGAARILFIRTGAAAVSMFVIGE